MDIKIPLIKRSRIRLITNRLSLSEEFLEQLDVEIEKIIKKAKERAEKNKRRTLLRRDL